MNRTNADAEESALEASSPPSAGAGSREDAIGSANAPEGPWLSDEEQWVWRAFLAVHRRLMESLERQLQRDAAMSLQDYVILSMLSEAPDRRLRMTDLAFISHSSPSRTSHAVDRLETRQWVRRERSDEDGRGSLAVLTDVGLDQVEHSAPGHSDAVRTQLFDLMSGDELAVFGRVLFAVLDRFHDSPPGAPPVK